MATTIKRPTRIFSFGDHSKYAPKEPQPGDRLDAQFYELIEAIQTTQAALDEIRRDDGQLRGPATLDDKLTQQLVSDFTTGVQPIADSLAGQAKVALNAERNASLYAKDAEAAVQTARILVDGMAALRHTIETTNTANTAAAEVADMFSTEAENWANYAKAQADNAIAAKDEALAWAEYLAGPVIDAAKAPAYIAASKFPNGLFYQAVDGGVAGLWSSKWWALYARNIVGTVGLYYLGAWDHPPLPGEVNPDTGQVIPPLKPGSIYFNSTDDKLYVWNGSEWIAPQTLMQTFAEGFVYQATVGGQQDFFGPDLNANTPAVGTKPSDVHVNGVRLIPALDYTVNTSTNTLHINSMLAAGSVVQWDLLMPASELAPGSINAWKLDPLGPIDGSNQDFTLSYWNGTATVPTNVGSGAQLMVLLDGVVQEPGADYTAAGASMHMAAPPMADADLWAVWYQPGAPA